MRYRGKRVRCGGKEGHLPVRGVLAAVLVAVGALCIVFRFWGMRFSGFLMLGAALLLVLSLVLDALARRGGAFLWLRRIFLGCVAVGVLMFAVLEGQVLRAGHSTPTEAEAIIVLGAGVNGTEPSLALKSRLDAAAEYAEAYPDIPLVLSGGQGWGEEITEAECMRRYLVACGIEESRLLPETESTDTEENFRLSKALLEQKGYDTAEMTVAVVSNDFHLCRAEILARREGFTVTGVGAPIPWLHLEVNYYIREAFALVKTYFL